jgi:hypothetical protein
LPAVDSKWEIKFNENPIKLIEILLNDKSIAVPKGFDKWIKSKLEDKYLKKEKNEDLKTIAEMLIEEI